MAFYGAETWTRRRRGRRRKKLLDDLKDRREYFHLKEEALDRTMCRNSFGGAFGPVVRENTEWINEWIADRRFVHNKIIQAIKSAVFSSKRTLYILSTNNWLVWYFSVYDCPNVYNSDDLKENIYKELEKIFNQFPTYWTNILLCGFNAKLKKKYIFTRNIWSESLHEYRKRNF